MGLFDILYLIIAMSIIVFQAFVIPVIFCSDYKIIPKRDKIRKFIEQFLSSTIGFYLLYYLLRKSLYAITKEQYTLFNIADILLLAISLMGVSGFLSFAIYHTSVKMHEYFGKK
jgi:peptidoglycan biosynthesis protein MviN/MurJ (putative lipid II flippase)